MQTSFFCPITRDVRVGRRFIIHVFKRKMFFPRPVFALWILKPRCIFVGKADDQNVIPPVVIEISHESKKCVEYDLTSNFFAGKYSCLVLKSGPSYQ